MLDDTSWRDKAAHDLQNTPMSVAAIGEKYSRSHSTIQKLIKERGIVRSKGSARRGPRGISTDKWFSQSHRVVGIKISYFVARNSYRYSSKLFGFSVQRIRKMELGQYDFRLSELEKISEVLDMPLDGLLESFMSKQPKLLDRAITS
ncbi:helix-turn-helix transcriptional regulator [Rhizobium sp. Root483D2]|uniref:helix-turn-helix domain-containing protein n=1 Tax=Rhizobium sp. Root483D2 TaxID=1736545 RepID=UPI0007150F0B|nr:helix-turn-helix transcriptional regulator [Rhizobium sp. Root483D2]KQY25935.1 hypothetical protein ASD32_25990 [Rhizobium sp. Root483D2]